MTDICVLKRPSPQSMYNTVSDRFSATVLGGGAVIPNSNEWWVVQNDYHAFELYHSIAEQQWRETDPRYACCDNLVKMAALNGIYPRPAKFARGYMRLTGTVGATLPSSIEVAAGGNTYVLDTGVSLPPTMPSGGSLVVRMTAVDPGLVGNSTAGATTGKLTTPITGVDQTVAILGARMCGGAEAETCDAFRTRYLNRLSYARRANYQALIDDILEWPCATRACLRECSCCPERGRFDFYIFFDGTFEHGIPSDDIVEEMTDWFFGDPQGFGLGQADIGIEGRFYAAKAVPLDVRVSNIPCTSEAQMAEIQSRIEGMFVGLCPGKQVCRRMIDAVVIGVLGPMCEFDVDLKPVGSAAPFCEDFIPACDELPVAGTISVSGGSLR